MATVTQAKLHPITVSGDQATVTVDYDLDFTSDEIGQYFKLVIELFAKDGKGDEEPAQIWPPAKPLYTFTFGSGFFKTTSVGIKPTTPVVSKTETRTLQREKLNEDKGGTTHQLPDGNTIFLPDPDEVYAKITLSRESSKSTTAENVPS